MRTLLFVTVILICSIPSLAQQGEFATKPLKHQFYAYWGWNRAWFTRTDIHFHGGDYDFLLAKVVAHDKQNPIAFDPYLDPTEMTIPQTNLRVGFFLTDHWSVSLGLDHMKYVMDAYQIVDITGSIQNSNTAYDGTYDHDQIALIPGFLQFEHTNGLNYIHVALRRHDTLVNLKRYHLPNIVVNLVEGVGAGPLVPKTNTTLLNYDRYDEFHLAGYGMDVVAGLNITFFDHFFIQSELKGGFCNMPDIRTTEFTADRADEHFFFFQSNIVLGVNYKF